MILEHPAHRGYEFIAYAQMGFSYKEIGEFFGFSEEVVRKVTERLAADIQKERFKTHIQRIEDPDGPKPA